MLCTGNNWQKVIFKEPRNGAEYVRKFINYKERARIFFNFFFFFFFYLIRLKAMLCTGNNCQKVIFKEPRNGADYVRKFINYKCCFDRNI